MKFSFKKELPLLLLAVFPASFLLFIWKELPLEVPLHWGINGEIDRYGSKIELLFLGLIPVILYALFLFLPLIDPKKRLGAMGTKFYIVRLIMALFLAVLFTYIIYSVKKESLLNPNYLFAIIGAFFVLLGNYFKTIKPNYFVGIRTPWTLENEAIWKSTHILAGKLWVIGGLLIIFSSFIFTEKTALTMFLIITGIITLIPVAHSYQQFKKTAALIIMMLVSSTYFAQGNLNRPNTRSTILIYG